MDYDEEALSSGANPITKATDPDPTPVTPDPTPATPEKKTEDAALPSAEDLIDLANLGKPVEKPAEPVVDEIDKLELPTSASKNAHESFSKLKEISRAEKARAAELEAKLAAAEAAKNDIDPAELDRLRKINSEYEKELQVTRVEATQEYKEAVLEPLSKVQSSVAAIAAKYEVSKDALITALADTESDALTDLVSGMNDRDRFRVYELADQLAKVHTISERVKGNAALALQKIQEHRDSQIKSQQTEYQKVYGTAVEQTWEGLSKQVPMFRKVEGNEAWNSQIEEVERFARSVDLNNPDPSVRAGIAIRAAVSPMLLTQVNTLAAQLKDAKAQLAKFQGAVPKAGGGAAAPVAEGKPEYSDFMEAIRANLK